MQCLYSWVLFKCSNSKTSFSFSSLDSTSVRFCIHARCDRPLFADQCGLQCHLTYAFFPEAVAVTFGNKVQSHVQGLIPITVAIACVSELNSISHYSIQLRLFFPVVYCLCTLSMRYSQLLNWNCNLSGIPAYFLRVYLSAKMTFKFTKTMAMAD
ncbi:uncharacterized protein LOC144615079 [Panthera onca]